MILRVNIFHDSVTLCLNFQVQLVPLLRCLLRGSGGQCEMRYTDLKHSIMYVCNKHPELMSSKGEPRTTLSTTVSQWAERAMVLMSHWRRMVRDDVTTFSTLWFLV